MSHSTRLRAQPSRRINYAGNKVRSDPVTIEDPLSPVTAVRSPKPGASARGSVRNSTVRVKAGAIVKPTLVLKDTPRPKKTRPAEMNRPRNTECSICATTKNTARSFRIPVEANACEHFGGTCNSCIQKLLETKIRDRRLDKAELACPFPDCNNELDMRTLKATISKAAFEDWNDALVKYSLSASDNYIACLKPRCGKYFSIEDCKGGPRRKNKVACPYCKYEMCFSCNRPWHKSSSCSKLLEMENTQSEKAIQDMGAKPCPRCGVNITKQGGCDHMTCQQCLHNFCWQCLTAYSANMTHGPDCPHAVTNITQDARNWIPDGLNMNQVNNLIHRAHTFFDAARDQQQHNQLPRPQPPPEQVPQLAPIPPVIPHNVPDLAQLRADFLRRNMDFLRRNLAFLDNIH